MSWEPCKAADLKEGDRVRVTVEGVVIPQTTTGGLVCITWDRDRAETAFNAMSHDALDAGKLERQERPLAEGQYVRLARDGSDLIGTVRLTHNGQACVLWPHGLGVHRIEALERAQ